MDDEAVGAVVLDWPDGMVDDLVTRLEAIGIGDAAAEMAIDIVAGAVVVAISEGVLEVERR